MEEAENLEVGERWRCCRCYLGRRRILPIHFSAYIPSAAAASALILPFRYFLRSSLMPPRGFAFLQLSAHSHTHYSARAQDGPQEMEII